MEALGAAAKAARVSQDALADSYLKNHACLTSLNYSTQEQIDYQQAVAEALKLSGASASQAAQVQDLLSKALDNGGIKGKQLAEVMLNGGRVAQALADQPHVPVSQLSLMADGLDDAMQPRVKQALQSMSDAANAALDDVQKKAEARAKTRQASENEQKSKSASGSTSLDDTTGAHKQAPNTQWDQDIKKFQQNLTLMKQETAARASATGTIVRVRGKAVTDDDDPRHCQP